MIDKIADTVLQQDIKITFDVRPTSWVHGFLQKLNMWPFKKLYPLQQTYCLKPITLGTLIKISKLLIDIDMSVFDMKNLLESNYQAIVKHGGTVARIAAIAIHGRPGDVPADIVNAVLNNFTTRELQGTMQVILGQMNVQDFMFSIISIKGMNMEMSPSNQEETIAPGPLSAVS